MFDFIIYDGSVNVAVYNIDASYIKSVIKDNFQNTITFLCIVVNQTCKSKWILWEIENAVEQSNRTCSTNEMPVALCDVSANQSISFT